MKSDSADEWAHGEAATVDVQMRWSQDYNPDKEAQEMPDQPEYKNSALFKKPFFVQKAQGL